MLKHQDLKLEAVLVAVQQGIDRVRFADRCHHLCDERTVCRGRPERGLPVQREWGEWRGRTLVTGPEDDEEVCRNLAVRGG